MDKKSTETVKEWLGRYRDAKWECRRLEGEYRDLVESQQSISAIQYSDMPKATDYERDLSGLFVRRDKYIVRIIQARTKMCKIRAEILAEISQIKEPDQRTVLSMRYIQLDGYRYMSWEDIAAELHYGMDNVFKLHRNALKTLKSKVKSSNLQF